MRKFGAKLALNCCIMRGCEIRGDDTVELVRQHQCEAPASAATAPRARGARLPVSRALPADDQGHHHRGRDARGLPRRRPDRARGHCGRSLRAAHPPGQTGKGLSGDRLGAARAVRRTLRRDRRRRSLGAGGRDPAPGGSARALSSGRPALQAGGPDLRRAGPGLAAPWPWPPPWPAISPSWARWRT